MVVQQDERVSPAGLLRVSSRSGGGRAVDVHSQGGGRHALPVAGSCASAVGCRDCPWVDFRDYDQCGLTFPPCGHAAGVSDGGRRT